MGGAGFIFTGENDADIMHNSASINLNMVEASVKSKIKKIFYSSSACMYPERNQTDPDNPNCAEDSATLLSQIVIWMGEVFSGNFIWLQKKLA